MNLPSNNTSAEYGEIIALYAVSRTDHEMGPSFHFRTIKRQLLTSHAGESVRYSNYYWPLRSAAEFGDLLAELKDQSKPGPVYASGIDLFNAEARPHILIYRPELSRPAPMN